MIPEKFKKLEFLCNGYGVEYVALPSDQTALWVDEWYRDQYPEFFDKEGFNVRRYSIHNYDPLTKEALNLVKTSQEYRDYIINFVIKNRL